MDEPHDNGVPDAFGIDGRPDLRPHADVVAQRIDDDVVLVHLRTNEIYVLNRTAARAWELLSEGRRSTDVIESLAAEFGTDVATVAAELDRLADDLVIRTLAERA